MLKLEAPYFRDQVNGCGRLIRRLLRAMDALDKVDFTMSPLECVALRLARKMPWPASGFEAFRIGQLMLKGP